MKKSFTLLILLALLASTLVFSNYLAKPASGSAKPYYKVEPEEITFGPESALNEEFNVTIKLYNATSDIVPDGIQGVEVHFKWDNSLIQPVSYSTKLGQTGGVLNPSVLTTLDGLYDEAGEKITSPPYTNATYYKVAGASTGDAWYGSEGIIATITFKVIYQPEWWYHESSCVLNLTFTDLVDSNIVSVDHEKYNGYYEIVGLNPSPVPVIKVVPSTVSMGPDADLGKTFTVAVEMHDVNPDGLPSPYGIYGVEVWLEWNDTLIKPVSYTQYVGNDTVGVLNSPVFFVYDNLTDSSYMVAASSLPPAEPWSGSGKIVEITFQVVFQKVQPYPDLSCLINITFSDVQMLPDDKLFAIYVPHTTESGSYEIHQFPKVNTYSVTAGSQTFNVAIESDSIIFAPTNLGVDLVAKTITFNVTTTDGYCNVTIPKGLMTGPWTVYIDGSNSTFVSSESSTNTYLWFEFAEGEHVIVIEATWIVPEYPSALLLLMMLPMVVVAIVISKKKPKK
ncbi:MAG: hypothetical protein QXZ70_00850 [Candidatus Bathyarchaeia archaeon]